MAATLQRNCSGGIIFVIITKIITKEMVPRNHFVIISARMVVLGRECIACRLCEMNVLLAEVFTGGENVCCAYYVTFGKLKYIQDSAYIRTKLSGSSR